MLHLYINTLGKLISKCSQQTTHINNNNSGDNMMKQEGGGYVFSSN